MSERDKFFGDSKIGKIRTALLELYNEHKAAGNLPTSARFLYYELIAKKVISKVKTGARRTDQDMLDALTDLREKINPATNEPFIPWDAITDETRELTEWNTCTTIRDGMRHAWENASLDLWEGDPSPMILCESRSLRGVLEQLAYDYHAPIASTNGQCAGFLHTAIAPALEPGQQILYLGDLDFGGGHIEENTRAVLTELVGDLTWDRIAVTAEQAEEYDIEPILKLDKRDGKKHPAIETEALGQSRIVALLRARLAQLMPTKRVKAVQERERQEREAIGRKLNYLKKGESL
jgi:hypothetical protein